MRGVRLLYFISHAIGLFRWLSLFPSSRPARTPRTRYNPVVSCSWSCGSGPWTALQAGGRYAVLVFLLALLLVGCAPAGTRPARTAATTNWFVTQFGEQHSQDGVWRVSVPSADQPFELSRGQYLDGVRTTNSVGFVGVWTGALTNTYTTDGWRAQPGWFVFVEDESRAWCYDGANFLWLLRVDPDGSSGSYGPRLFPCPVPQPVYARLTDAARKAIARDGR
jgi:hypothetical protein